MQKRLRLLKSASCNHQCQPRGSRCQSDFADEIVREYLSDCGTTPELPIFISDGDILALRIRGSEDDYDLHFEKRVSAGVN